MPSRPDDPTRPLPHVPPADDTSGAGDPGGHPWATAVTPDAASAAPGAPGVPDAPGVPAGTGAPAMIAAPAVTSASATSAPAVTPPRWSGRKTAVAAALAVGLGVGAAAGATTAFALGRDDGRAGDTSQLGPGGAPGQGQLPGGPGGRDHDGDRGGDRDADGDGPGGVPGGQLPGGGSSTTPDDANGTAQTT